MQICKIGKITGKISEISKIKLKNFFCKSAREGDCDQDEV